MRQTKFLVLILSLGLILSLISCGPIVGTDKDVILKITARRIAFYGMKIKPEIFKPLGKIAKASCEQTPGAAEPLDLVFKGIVEAISTKTKDPLLAQDIKDIAELIGIKFDAAFTLIGLTPEKFKFLTLFVCAFSQGVQAANEQ